MRPLHHEKKDRSPVALLLIDVINPLDFERGEDLLSFALPMADRLAELKDRAHAAGIPSIYVNDNFGRWRSNFNRLIDFCTEEGRVGKPVVEKLRPADEDYFVLKPKHSGFFSTSLRTLLRYLEVRKTIITGMATDICVLFTANEAYMNDYGVVVPSDCVAAEKKEYHLDALKLMKRVLKADITASPDLDLDALLAEAGRQVRC
jgi:nicotinamidase-related amidase